MATEPARRIRDLALDLFFKFVEPCAVYEVALSAEVVAGIRARLRLFLGTDFYCLACLCSHCDPVRCPHLVVFSRVGRAAARLQRGLR